jgi:hypothetical protein
MKMEKDSKYDIWVMGRDEKGKAHRIKIDWYAFVRTLDLPSAIEHTLKKGIKIGKRSGGKSFEHDLEDMKWSLNREQELREMDWEINNED